MCKSWAIRYTCTHFLTFRLSTCRGSFTVTPRKETEPVASCKSTPSISLISELRCGPCSKTLTEEALARTIAAARARLGADEWDSELSESGSQELDRLEEEYGVDKWRLEKQYPDQGKMFKKTVRPEKGVRSSSRVGSLLRQEVKAGEVVVKEEPVKSATRGDWEDWGEGWKSLEEEIEEMDEERKAAGIEFSWDNSTATCQAIEEEDPRNDDGQQEKSSVDCGSEVKSEPQPETGDCVWPSRSTSERIETSRPLKVRDKRSSFEYIMEQKILSCESPAIAIDVA